MLDLDVLERIIEGTRKFLETAAKLRLFKVSQVKLQSELDKADELIAAGELEAALLQYQTIAKAFPKSGRPYWDRCGFTWNKKSTSMRCNFVASR